MSEKVHSSPSAGSRISTLRSAEDHWIWKAGVRIVICVINLVAIGCAAWLISSSAPSQSSGLFYGYVEVTSFNVGALITLCVSFVWCTLWITVPLFLKPPRPLHPGVPVGMDLVMWLAFLVVGGFTLFALWGLHDFGLDGLQSSGSSYAYGYGSSSSDGGYYLAPNNTWVYNTTSTPETRYEYNETTGSYEYVTVDSAPTERNCEPEFATCAEQDAYVNQQWLERPRKIAIQIVVNAIAWLDVILHFALFVWACVDTQRRNSTRSSRAMQLVADKIIADLERKGIVRVQDGVVMQARGPAEPYHLEETRRTSPTRSVRSHTQPDLVPETEQQQQQRHADHDTISPA